MSDEKIILHVGGGFFAPWRGEVPTKNPAEAMVFSSNEECDQFALTSGWAKAMQARQATPSDKLLREPNATDRG